MTLQKQTVYQAFMQHSKTMLQVSEETGVLRANICRYVDKWKKLGLIQQVKTGLCPVSGYKAGFYTTNETKAAKSLNLSE